MTTRIHDLYSRRKSRIENANQPEVYQYEKLPIEFRRQVVLIWDDAAPPSKYPVLWSEIHNRLIRYRGEFSLPMKFRPCEQEYSESNECRNFLLQEDSIDGVIDLVELSFKFIDKDVRKDILDKELDLEALNMMNPDEAIEELNLRFFEHAIGFQYNNGQIIRVDSNLIHTEAVLPALRLLSNQSFTGAEDEFLKAHKYYRQQEYKPAIVEALKSFESTLKTICDKCGWIYSPKDCSQDLIRIVFNNHLLPDYLRTQFSHLKGILGSGIPTVRNTTSAHGQGTHPTTVPKYLTAYVLHLTASNIVFLVEAYMAKQSITTSE
jgi:AbiJ N-terminal domain 4